MSARHERAVAAGTDKRRAYWRTVRSTMLAIAIAAGAMLVLDWAETHLPMVDDNGAPWTD